jgi:hypothetical protein
MSLSLDDFEWVEEGFDTWHLMHKVYSVTIAAVLNFNGWHVKVLNDPSMREPLHVDSLDAAKAMAQIIATQYMEKYSEQYFGDTPRCMRKRVKTDGPPTFRRGVFKVD